MKRGYNSPAKHADRASTILPVIEKMMFHNLRLEE
jgi:hypothetical protein